MILNKTTLRTLFFLIFSFQISKLYPASDNSQDIKQIVKDMKKLVISSDNNESSDAAAAAAISSGPLSPKESKATKRPEEENQSIILRFEGRNTAETNGFNRLIDQNKIKMEYIAGPIGLFQPSISDILKTHHFQLLPIKSLMSNQDYLNKLKANQDFAIPRYKRDSEIYIVNIDLRTFSFAFKVKGNYKYIIRMSPCDQNENNAIVVDDFFGAKSKPYLCVQEISQIKEENPFVGPAMWQLD